MSFWLRLCRFENLPSITFVCLSIYELYAETTALSSSPCPLRSCCCEVMERAGSEFISGDTCDSCDSLLVPSKLLFFLLVSLFFFVVFYFCIVCRWGPIWGLMDVIPPFLLFLVGWAPWLLRHWQWPIRHSRLPLS